MTKELIINRLYGPVPQGEGPTAGQPRVFLRLSRCDLKCVWCDVPETWDWDHHRPADHQTNYFIDHLANGINAMSGEGQKAGLVITGGEPMLQSRLITELLPMITDGTYIEVETNGRHAPTPGMVERVNQWNISPKLANSLNPDRLREPNPWWAANAAVFREGGSTRIGKFVVEDAGELGEVASIAAGMALLPHEVWVMPQARQVAELQLRHRSLEREVMRHGWRLSSRLQIIAWGTEPGH